jgi:hypothetical protein
MTRRSKQSAAERVSGHCQKLERGAEGMLVVTIQIAVNNLAVHVAIVAVGGAPWSSSHWATSRLPLEQAMCIGVLPQLPWVPQSSAR